MATFNVIIRNRVKKNGKTPVYYRVTLPPRKHHYFPTGIEVEPEYFDMDNGCLKSDFRGYKKYNTKFFQKGAEFTDLLSTNPYPVKADLELFFNPNTSEVLPFWRVMEIDLTNEKEYSQGTLNHRRVSIRHFKEFNSKINIYQIRPATIYQFIEHLRNKGLQASSIKNNLKFPKKTLTKYYRLGEITTDPAQGINPKEKNREETIKYLEMEDVEKINQIIYKENISDTHRRTALFFSIACETGQAYVDLRKSTNEILDTKIVPKTIYSTRTKSGSINSIPITTKAKEFYNLLIDRDSIFHKRIPSYNSYNKDLKYLALLAGIEKNITTHMARHTCACILLENDVPIEIVSAFLGHRDLRTTQIYAKIKNKKVEQAIADYDSRRSQKKLSL